MLKAIPFLLVLATAFPQDSAKDEAQVWNLEKAYWEYVKANDLEKYRALWHEDFLGWPYVSSAPIRKDHMTDWITAEHVQGREAPVLLHRAAGRSRDRRRRDRSLSNQGELGHERNSQSANGRVADHHTWIRTHGTWQILGGMSAPVNADGK